MDTPTPSLHEQGIRALREGNLGQAIELLTQAVMGDPQDAEALAFLGMAYSRQGQHTEARQAFESAVARQPGNPHYRFNLGVALEHAGDRQAAAGAYRETLQIDPRHPQATARLQALGMPLAAPGAGVSQSEEPTAGAPTGGARWPGGRPSTAPAAAAGPPGTVSCSHCGQWSRPGLSCEWCSSPLQSAPAPTAAPWLRAGRDPAPAGDLSGGIDAATVPVMGAGEAFFRRLAAHFLDSAILSVATYIVSFVLWFFVFAALIGTSGRGQAPNPAGPQTGPAILLVVLMIALALGIPITYYGGMLSARGQTLGKMALGLRVAGPDGGNPSFGRALLREIIGKFCSALLLDLGYLWMLWDSEQQTWHDKIAATHVELAGEVASGRGGSRSPAQRSQGPVIAGIIIAVGLVGMFVIVPILAAILFPVLAQARERARAASCMSNMRQLGRGMLMYAQDYDGRLPRKENWCDGVMAYAKDPRVFQCPSLGGERGAQAYNAQMSAVSGYRVAFPFRTIAAFDAQGGWNLAGGAKLAVPRHLQGLNVLFVDGRVSWMRSLGGVVWKPGSGAVQAGSGSSAHRRRRTPRHRRRTGG